MYTLNPSHPTAVLKWAWRNLRLDTIREAARVAIAELEADTRADLLARHRAGQPPSMTIAATMAAFVTCCSEVREEAGLPATGAPAHKKGPDSTAEANFQAELERYRESAGTKLKRLLHPE